jgi:hypothetical protein
MFTVKLSGTKRYGWSYSVYINGRYAASGDFFDTLEDAMSRISELLKWNGLS